MPAHEADRIYFDYAATAPFDTSLDAVLRSASWANANALYAEGREAASQLREARSTIAKALHAHAPSEIIFTSGGTEAINMAIKGLSRIAPKSPRSHVIVSAIEHPAVLNAARSLKEQGIVVDIIGCDANGIVDPMKLDGLLASIEDASEACFLVCIQGVNNEIGTVQPVRKLSEIAHAHGARFFCDAVQALGKIPIDLEDSGIDACAISAHKIGAPKGIGALYLRRGTKLPALLHGGGQESGFRSGTSNVPSACAFATALERACATRQETWDHVAKLKAHLLVALTQRQYAHSIEPALQSNDSCVPHILSLLIDGLEGETLVMRCDDLGIALSSGSACSSSSLDPSHVISALGISRDKAHGAIRLSFGRMSTLDEVDRFIEILPEVLR